MKIGFPKIAATHLDRFPFSLSAHLDYLTWQNSQENYSGNKIPHKYFIPIIILWKPAYYKQNNMSPLRFGGVVGGKSEALEREFLFVFGIAQ